MAYLCDELVSSSGRSIPMTGLLPARARYLGKALAEPAEVSFQVGSWLAPADMRLRGYRHGGWDIQPRASATSYATSCDGRADVFGCGTVIGSRVLVNLAANRHLLRRFFEPYTTAPAEARRES